MHLNSVNIFEDVGMSQRLQPQVSTLSQLDLRRKIQIPVVVSAFSLPPSLAHLFLRFVCKIEDKHSDWLSASLQGRGNVMTSSN